LPVLLALVALTGCGRQDSLDPVDSARASLAAGDAGTAAVQLRILLAEPGLTEQSAAELRLLFGRALLETGDAVGADVELHRALELGQAEAQVAPHLARAWLAQRKYQALVLRYGKTRLEGELPYAELKTLVATAYRNQGQLTEAEESVADALAALPTHQPALLMQANLRSARGDHRQAGVIIDSVLRSAPENVQAWTIKGQMLVASGESAQAVDAFEKALKFKADSVSAHTALIALELARPDLAAAEQRWKAMSAALPSHPQTRFHEAKLAFARGNAKRTRELTLPLLRSGDQNLGLLQLAGAAELMLKSPARAESLLSKAVALAPDAPAPRLMLAQAHLSGGQPARAVQTLRPLLESQSPPPQALLLAAQAALQAGDARAADALYSRAAKLYPKSADVTAARAIAKVRGTLSDQSLHELSAVLASQPDRSTALALVSARMARGEFGPALSTLQDMARSAADDPLPHELSGRIALRQRDPVAAERHFEQALVRDEAHYPAVAGLAAIDMGRGKADAAIRRFEALLVKEPDHLLALMALAEIRVRQPEGRAEAIRLLERATKAHPDSRGPSELLVQQWLLQQNFKAAVAAAQAGLAARADDPTLLDLLGRAQIGAGEAQQALSTYARLAAVAPRSPEPHLRAAEIQLAQRQPEAAAESVARARAIAPQALPVLRLAAGVAARARKFDQALAAAREAQAAHPHLAAGFLIEGEVHAMNGDRPAAERAFRAAINKQEADEAVRRLHMLLLVEGKTAEAAKVAVSWQSQHPTDMSFVQHLAARALDRKDYPAAEIHLRQVVRQQPRNAEALNNIAWLMVQQRKPGALAFAQRATQASPNNPALMDTLAMSHAAAQQFDKAIDVQQQVMKLVPESGAFRLNLGKIYLMAGDKVSARQALQPLAGKAFAGQVEARSLLASIEGGR